MKNIITSFSLLFLLTITRSAIAQSITQLVKPEIDTSILAKWPMLDNGKLTNNGHFLSYDYWEYSPQGIKFTVTLRSRDGEWHMTIADARRDVFFTQDSRYAIVGKNKDLYIVQLGKETTGTIDGVEDFNLIAIGNRDNRLLYHKIKEPDKLFLMDIATHKETCYNGVKEFILSADGSRLAMSDENGVQSVDVLTGEIKSLWAGKDARNLILDAKGSQLVFLESGDHKKLWYAASNKPAIDLSSQTVSKLADSVIIESIEQFSADGKNIFFTLNVQVHSKPPHVTKANVLVWGYRDPILQQLQLNSPAKDTYAVHSYAATIYLPDTRFIQLETATKTKDGGSENHRWQLLFENGTGDPGENYWSSASWKKCSLINVATGEERPLPFLPLYVRSINISISPGEKYLLWYDPFKKDYFSYDLATAIIRNITHSAKTIWTIKTDYPDPRAICWVTDGLNNNIWFKNDEALLLKSRYDIWRIDPSGKNAPINLTNNFNQKTHISLEAAYPFKEAIKDDTVLLMNAFDHQTKQQGFYNFNVHSGQTTKISMRDYWYEGSWIQTKMRKARDTSVYLFRQQDAGSFPNYYLTTDLKHFNAVSDIHPEKNVNWYTCQLVNYKTHDGIPTQGLLYKPENFDPKKKYPVIIEIYETFSDELHQYISPNWCTSAEVDIPYFVSNGYLVFKPDIKYKPAYLGESVYNSVIPAAKYLQKLPYVYPRKIGLTGHSHGGGEANYLVAHSHLFAAVMAGSGYADMVGWENWVLHDGTETGQEQVEQFQPSMIYTLSQRPDRYIAESPVFQADRVTTPLLLMANPKDAAVPYQHSMEFYMSLRRLGKRVWWLEYPDEGHTVGNDNCKDLTIRMKQYFDHYLMDRPAPIWMTRGIPASMAGAVTGYEYDTIMKTPGPGLNRPEVQKQIDKDAKIPLSKKLHRLKDDQ